MMNDKAGYVEGEKCRSPGRQWQRSGKI